MEELWEKAVETAIDGQTNSLPIKTLTLDGAVKCYNGRLPPPALLEKHQALEHLSIANIGLTSLENFPRLSSLQRLILSDNRIAGGLEFLVQAGLKSLRDLDLSNNRIQSLDDLKPLAQLDLVSLDLYECPVTRIRDYRVRVFGLIKSLKYLDKLDADENDEDEEEEEDEDEEDEEEGEGEGEDDEDGEIDGEDRLRKVCSDSGANGTGPSGGDGVIEVNEDEESEEDGIEEVGVASNGFLNHSSNGYRVANRNGDVVDDEEVEEEDEEEDDDDEELEEVDEEGSDSDDEDVVEVHEIEDSDEDEEGVEDEDGGDLDDDEEEVEDEEEDTGLENTDRLTDNGGEIDGHEQGEEDSDGDGEYEEEDGDDEEEDFQIRPVAPARSNGEASLDPENEMDDDLVNDDAEVEEEAADDKEHRDGNTIERPSSSSQFHLKRKRQDDDSDDGDDDDDDDDGDDDSVEDVSVKPQ